jgi:hypothetical protein
LLHQGGEEGLGVYAVGGVVRAGVDATGFFQMCAEVAGGCFLLHCGFLAAGVIGIFGHYFEWMEIDIAVGAIPGAEAATDAPIFDNDFQGISAPDCADRTTHHA